MRKLIFFSIVFLLCAVFPLQSFAQLKKDIPRADISGTLTRPGNDMILGFLDPSRMNMQHSISMSYAAFGGNGMMLNSYLNTLNYQITDKLFLRTDLGIMTSPYHTFGENSSLNKPQFFGGAQLKYQFNENSSLLLRFESAPHYYYQPTLGGYRFNNFE